VLESYRLPRELRAAGDRKGALGKFFLDDDELAASESLSASLKASLDESAILIVVASRAAAVSNQVNDPRIDRLLPRGSASASGSAISSAGGRDSAGAGARLGGGGEAVGLGDADC
jgi:hypothetical protein